MERSYSHLNHYTGNWVTPTLQMKPDVVELGVDAVHHPGPFAYVPPRPCSPESGPLPPNHANVKRGSRSRAGQSAAKP